MWSLTFVPHLTPMIRGIHATLLCPNKGLTQARLQELLRKRYANEPFVDVMPAGSHPATRSVRGKFRRIAVHYHEQTGQIIVLSVIDNLTKGASGQGVQNLNIMFGLPERMGFR